MPNLAFQTRGDPALPSLMLLHGFMSSNAQWLLNVDALAAHYHVVMVELWGHGRSPAPEDPHDYSIAVYIEQFERIRVGLGIDRWSLVGQSYGAGLTIRYALAQPEYCTAVVVTNSRSAFGKVDASADARPGRSPRPTSTRDLPFHPINARRFPPEVKAALVTDADAVSMDVIRHSGGLGRALNCVDAVGHLNAPILLVNGSYEKAFQPEVEALRSRHPSVVITDLDGGHSVNIEAAADFNRTVLDFLKTRTVG